MSTPPHLAELELGYATTGRPEDFLTAAMRVFAIELDDQTWPSLEVFEPERSFGFRVDGRWVATCTAYSRQLTVPGGATYREAHLVMEMLHDSGLVQSVDIVELNPFLDERGRTARTAVELIGSLFGQQITDRPTPSNAIEPDE